MGRFTDASVVTEADRPRVFEFVTEAHLATKKGRGVDWTNVHRYELSPQGTSRCRIDYRIRITRISQLPGMLGMFKVPLLSVIAMKASEGVARRGVRNLAALAEELEEWRAPGSRRPAQHVPHLLPPRGPARGRAREQPRGGSSSRCRRATTRR